jgi:hypothetical protein
MSDMSHLPRDIKLVIKKGGELAAINPGLVWLSGNKIIRRVVIMVRADIRCDWQEIDVEEEE